MRGTCGWLLSAALSAGAWTSSCRYDYELLDGQPLGGSAGEGPGSIGDGGSAAGVGGGGEGAVSTSDSGGGLGPTTLSGGSTAAGGSATTNDGTSTTNGATSSVVATAAGGGTATGSATGSGGATGSSGGSGGATEPPLVVTTAEDEEDASATADDPLGTGLSLREAILLANAQPGHQTISFVGQLSIELASAALPTITDSVDVIGPASIDGAGLPSASGCLLIDSSDVTVSFLNVYNCPAEPISIEGGSGNEISDCTLMDSGQSLAAAGAGHRILRNTVVGSDGAGIWCSAANSELFWNRVVDTAAIGIQLTSEASGTELVGNILIRSAYGIAVAPATNVVIAHNTIFDSGVGVAIDGALQVDFRNSIVASSSSAGILVSAGDFATLDASLFFDNGGNDCQNCTPGPDCIFGDPRFVDSATDDLSVLADSPAIDRGIDLGYDRNAERAGDFNGSAPDLGAIEAF